MARKYSEGARPGGDLAGVVGETATDAALAFVGESAPELAGKVVNTTGKVADAAIGTTKSAAAKVANTAKNAGDAVMSGKNAVLPTSEIATQGLKDGIEKVLKTKDPAVVDTVHDLMEPHKWFSSMENDVKLVKPKIDAELAKANSELDGLRDSSTKTIDDAKDTIHSYFDDATFEATSGLNSTAVTKGIHNVRDFVMDRLADGPMNFKDLNDVKRAVADEIKKFDTGPNQIQVVDSVAKAEQDALKGVRTRIQDLENQAEPAAKDVNTRISNLMDAADAFRKKFPTLDTADKVANSYASGKAQGAKKLGIGAAKTGARAVGLGAGVHLVE